MIIGITAGIEEVVSPPWVEMSTIAPHNYARSVQRAGARAVLLAPDGGDPDELLDALGAVIISGATADIDPALFGAERHARTQPIGDLRDSFELGLTRAALERGIPLLGVCRGMQVLNVACGGTLEQHLPEALGHDRHRGEPGSYAVHGVRIAPGSLTARAMGAERAQVKSYHHQGVRDVGEGLVASAWSDDDDGIVEAIERVEGSFALGLLWHPEEDDASHVLEALVAAG